MNGNSFNNLIKKPENDNYIYRGESRAFHLVCSGLFREYSRPCDMEDCCAGSQEVISTLYISHKA